MVVVGGEEGERRGVTRGPEGWSLLLFWKDFFSEVLRIDSVASGLTKGMFGSEHARKGNGVGGQERSKGSLEALS